MSHTFVTTIDLNGKTATGFRVPVEVVEAMGAGRRPKVTVTLNGHSYRSTVAVYGGVPMLPLSAQNRAAAGVRAGERATVTLELDDAPRTVEIPDDLARALAAEPTARASFEALSYSRRRAHVDAVTSAKRPETRARRIARIVGELSEQ
ncbi:MAG: YdeI/OmpD-associated family protein [Collinsella sp.]|nr:YdeI/OmpD-associated family protein [Collinsella sp.]